MITMVLLGTAIWLTLAIGIAFGWSRVFGQANLRAAAMVKPPVRMYVDPVFVDREIERLELQFGGRR